MLYNEIFYRTAIVCIVAVCVFPLGTEWGECICPTMASRSSGPLSWVIKM